MDCTEFLERYSEYDDSLVAADEAGRFRAHMAVCEGCERYDRVLRKGRMLARQLPGPEPSTDFVPQLHMRLWSERVREARSTPRVPLAVAALPAVTIVMTLAVLLAAAPGSDGPRAPISRSGPVSHQDAVSRQGAVSRQASASPVTGVSRSAHPSSFRSVHFGDVDHVASGVWSGALSGGAGRVLALPAVRLAAGATRPVGWTAPRVDPEAFGSYSPLTMGPPAYGGAKSRLGVSLTMYPSPD